MGNAFTGDREKTFNFYQKVWQPKVYNPLSISSDEADKMNCDICLGEDKVGYVDDKLTMKVCRYCDIDGSNFNPKEWDEKILEARKNE